MPKVLGTPTVRFNLQNKHKEETPLSLIFRYRYQGTSTILKYGPGIMIQTKNWDIKNSYPKRGLQTNRLIGDLLRLEKIVIAIYEKTGGDISPREFRQELRYDWEKKPRPEEEKEVPPTFLEFVSQYVKDRKSNKSITRGTWKVLQTWEGHLKRFSEYRGKELTYDCIDSEFKEAFIDWCYSVNNHSINYVSKGLTVIRQFMGEAKEKGLTDNNYPQTKSFRLKKIPTPTIALGREELDAIYNIDLSSYPKGYRKARILFLIGAYTGLRHSDYKRIKPVHVVKENGYKSIQILAWKTKKFVKIPLHPNLEAILEGCEYKAPKLSQQKLNNYIKEVAKLAGITEIRMDFSSAGGNVVESPKAKYELISSHTARRTFATQARINNWPTPLIRAITGHSTDRQLDNYIDHQIYLANTEIREFYKKENDRNLRAVK